MIFFHELNKTAPLNLSYHTSNVSDTHKSKVELIAFSHDPYVACLVPLHVKCPTRVTHVTTF